jgi:hypothetical protein
MSIGSKNRQFTGAGSASSPARLGAWFFPESVEVSGEIAAAGCPDQPGEKIEYMTSREADAQPSQKESYNVDDTQTTVGKRRIQSQMLSF